MRRYLIALFAVIAFIAASGSVRAQGLYVGVRGGINISSVTDRPNSTAKVGGNFGAMGGYQFSSIFALQVEALYSFQGYQSGNIAVGLSPTNTFINLDYLKIPVLVKIFLFRGLNFELGASFNFLVSALDVTTPLRGFSNFDISIPIGLSYRFGRHFEVGVRYDISTFRVDPVVTGANSLFSINVGWKF